MAKVTLTAMTNIQISYDLNEPTLADIRKFIELADKLGVSDDTELLDCVLSLDVPTKAIELITCGEHVPSNEDFHDILIYTHDCDTDLEARQLAEDNL
ncbi:hypothetical protein UFOVP621_100 [uncultured Caudovirales phage]|uniref:Uncharacterized protein n=1 Tax=uncultured Caudovirales phage TaxID=2100421 RepID=A0A6J5N2K4_9CAUD|nr:hypothetical protein UFOVP621_100 [uncultured Caudovirales phage]